MATTSIEAEMNTYGDDKYGGGARWVMVRTPRVRRLLRLGQGGAHTDHRRRIMELNGVSIKGKSQIPWNALMMRKPRTGLALS